MLLLLPAKKNGNGRQKGFVLMTHRVREETVVAVPGGGGL